jgi:hypothetical protein
MMHVIPWSKVKDNDIIDVAIGKTKVRQSPIYNFLKLYKVFLKPNVKNNHWCKQSFPLKSIPPNVVLALPPSSMIINGSQKVDESLGLPNCVKNLL